MILSAAFRFEVPVRASSNRCRNFKSAALGGRRVKRVAPFVALILVLGRAASAFAADPRYPDWPCNQIKVPELSVAAIWTGPPIDDVGDTWERDPQIKDL